MVVMIFMAPLMRRMVSHRGSSSSLSCMDYTLPVDNTKTTIIRTEQDAFTLLQETKNMTLKELLSTLGGEIDFQDTRKAKPKEKVGFPRKARKARQPPEPMEVHTAGPLIVDLIEPEE